MELSVVYSSDNNYAQHVGVSMISLFDNNQEFENISIFLIENKISNENKKNLINICDSYNRTIKFIDFKEFAQKLNLNTKNEISINAYARLFISSAIEKNVDKILYLDCDSVINESLCDLWSLDINKFYVAGVADTVGEHTKLRIKMDVNSPYINSGMLLINLKKWREEEIEKNFIDFIDSFEGHVFHHDQGVVNGVLNNNMLILHPKYNAMTPLFTMNRDEIMEYYGMREYYNQTEINEAIINPVFIHYTPAFVNRPWIKGSRHPLTNLYKKYLGMTPWKNSKLQLDKRTKGEKMVSFLYNNLPFKMAHNICHHIFK